MKKESFPELLSYEYAKGFLSKGFRFREYITKNYSWGLLFEEDLKAIQNFPHSKILDIGAGSGYLSYLLQKYTDKQVQAIDLYPTHPESWKIKPKYFPVHRYRSKEALLAHIKSADPETTLFFLSWPPYDTPAAYEIFQAIPTKAKTQTTILYLGELAGANGDDKFEDLLFTLNPKPLNKNRPTWEYLHDDLYLITKNHSE